MSQRGAPDRDDPRGRRPFEPDEIVVKARTRPDGTLVTDTYWGGDPGHAHAVVDEHGRVHYLRESSRDLPGQTRRERVDLDDRRQTVDEIAAARRRMDGDRDRPRNRDRDAGR